VNGLPTTPDDWITFLIPKLQAQAEAARLFRRYYRGEHRISEATARFREIFGRFFTTTADNWMQIVVDSPVERLAVQGFRFGDSEMGEFGTEMSDKGAWELWQRCNLDSRQRTVHTEAGKCGRAYVLVDKTGEEPVITPESPCEVYVHLDPGSGKRLAAIKQWVGDDKHAYVTLYLPDATFKRRTAGQVRGLTGRPNYEPLGASKIPNEDGVVPVIPFENNPDIHDGGISDLEAVIPLQDRVNKLCLDLDVSSEFYAAPQRYATGWDPPTDENDKPLPNTQVDAVTSRFLAFTNPETTVGALPSGDPAAYVVPIEMYIQHIAAISKTPPHYLLGKMANLSGDALKAAETGLVAKVQAKQDDFGDAWEEAIGLALGKDADTAEVIWRDPESRTFAQLVDGVTKLHESLDIPRPMAYEMVGLSPQQIERAEKWLKAHPPEPAPMIGGGGPPPAFNGAASARPQAAAQSSSNGRGETPSQSAGVMPANGRRA
jgi:hypothetical protein